MVAASRSIRTPLSFAVVCLQECEAARVFALCLLVRHGAVGLYDLVGIAVAGDLAFVHPDHAVAHLADRLERVRDEHDGGAAATELADAFAAAKREADVADRERLVDQQHVELSARHDAEREPALHPRRVRAHRVVDELAQTGKLDDPGLAAAHLHGRRAVEAAHVVDVLAAGAVEQEPRGDLQYCVDVAMHDHGAARGL